MYGRGKNKIKAEEGKGRLGRKREGREKKAPALAFSRQT